ncbi:Integral membrane protein OS=Streptomyces alboniger OX=132473 GN=CP975_14280 PE=4 SV=1 [Streptomyces alboniger]
MQGHGYAQPVRQAPPTGLLVFLRVLFVVISVMSCGLLMWTMMLRLAVVTRRALDWWLCAVVIVAEALGLYLIGSEPGEEIHTPGGWTGLAFLLGTLVASVSYYLAADVRHFQQIRFSGYAPQQPSAPAYGYPQAQTQGQSPYNATTAPQHPAPQHPAPQHPIPHSSAPRTPVPPPPPQRPAPARIDQVRAELDELSDYLRRQDGQHNGHHDGNHEGGR